MSFYLLSDEYLNHNFLLKILFTQDELEERKVFFEVRPDTELRNLPPNLISAYSIRPFYKLPGGNILSELHSFTFLSLYDMTGEDTI